MVYTGLPCNLMGRPIRASPGQGRIEPTVEITKQGSHVQHIPSLLRSSLYVLQIPHRRQKILYCLKNSFKVMNSQVSMYQILSMDEATVATQDCVVHRRWKCACSRHSVFGDAHRSLLDTLQPRMSSICLNFSGDMTCISIAFSLLRGLQVRHLQEKKKISFICLNLILIQHFKFSPKEAIFQEW